MSHLPTPQMRGRKHAPSADQSWRALLPEWAQNVGEAPEQGAALCWVLRCDTCGHECWNDGANPAYATYVPDAWRTNPDGTHTCTDCLSIDATGHPAACYDRVHGFLCRCGINQ